jgi:hypothetical protein
MRGKLVLRVEVDDVGGQAAAGQLGADGGGGDAHEELAMGLGCGGGAESRKMWSGGGGGRLVRDGTWAMWGWSLSRRGAGADTSLKEGATRKK